MSFLEVIDNLIVELNLNLENTRSAKSSKEYHSTFVANRMNNYAENSMKNNPDNPAAVLNKTLKKIPQAVKDCFDHVEQIESNIIAASDAYKKVRNAYVDYEKNQKDAIINKTQKPLDSESDPMLSRAETKTIESDIG